MAAHRAPTLALWDWSHAWVRLIMHHTCATPKATPDHIAHDLALRREQEMAELNLKVATVDLTQVDISTVVCSGSHEISNVMEHSRCHSLALIYYSIRDGLPLTHPWRPRQHHSLFLSCPFQCSLITSWYTNSMLPLQQQTSWVYICISKCRL